METNHLLPFPTPMTLFFPSAFTPFFYCRPDTQIGKVSAFSLLNAHCIPDYVRIFKMRKYYEWIMREVVPFLPYLSSLGSY